MKLLLVFCTVTHILLSVGERVRKRLLIYDYTSEEDTRGADEDAGEEQVSTAKEDAGREEEEQGENISSSSSKKLYLHILMLQHRRINIWL
jgi:hypothetical protein